jgi:hypothetical protein
MRARRARLRWVCPVLLAVWASASVADANETAISRVTVKMRVVAKGSVRSLCQRCGEGGVSAMLNKNASATEVWEASK